ncbi:MAG: FG-GAP-like repeat-containing protein [Balneolaceae bacterium]
MKKTAGWKKIVLFLFFAGLIATPALLREVEERQMGERGMDRETALQRHGVWLQEVSRDVGIDFVHHRPTLDPLLEHIHEQVASVGASVSITDYNRDGFPDIYLTNSRFGASNALYRNRGDGTFEDVADSSGLARLNEEGVGVSMGAVWGDYTGNGYEDLFLYRWGRPELFRNLGNGEFERATREAGLPEWINANTAVWMDVNRDGYLDLFIGGYFHEEINFWNLESTRIMPDSYEYATNGGRNYLFLNNGDGTFEDVTESWGLLETRRWTLASTSADLNDDGYVDLMLANDYGVDELYLNDRGERFRRAGEESGLGFVPKSGMSADLGDPFNRGELSIYVTNISEPGVLMQGNNLWVPSGTRDGLFPVYRNLASSLGIERGEWGYGGAFGDLNNDGFQDLYVANGYVSAEPGTDYWYDYAKVVGGNRQIIGDARNWPAMNGRTFSGYQQNKIWINTGSGSFREVSTAIGGALSLDSRSIAYADLFGNGGLDLVVANQNGAVQVYRTTARPDHEWIRVQLEGRPPNTSAIGASVTFFWNGMAQQQVVTAGRAFSSQSERTIHFGLGTDPELDRLEIRWPDGKQTILRDLKPNRSITIEQPEN